jgi:hypothetical protein
MQTGVGRTAGFPTGSRWGQLVLGCVRGSKNVSHNPGIGRGGAYRRRSNRRRQGRGVPPTFQPAGAGQGVPPTFQPAGAGQDDAGFVRHSKGQPPTSRLEPTRALAPGRSNPPGFSGRRPLAATLVAAEVGLDNPPGCWYTLLIKHSSARVYLIDAQRTCTARNVTAWHRQPFWLAAPLATSLETPGDGPDYCITEPHVLLPPALTRSEGDRTGLARPLTSAISRWMGRSVFLDAWGGPDGMPALPALSVRRAACSLQEMAVSAASAR